MRHAWVALLAVVIMAVPVAGSALFEGAAASGVLVVVTRDGTGPPSIVTTGGTSCSTGWNSPTVGGWNGWASCWTNNSRCGNPAAAVKADVATVTGSVMCANGALRTSPQLVVTANAPDSSAGSSTYQSFNSGWWECRGSFGASGQGAVTCLMPE